MSESVNLEAVLNLTIGFNTLFIIKIAQTILYNVIGGANTGRWQATPSAPDPVLKVETHAVLKPFFR